MEHGQSKGVKEGATHLAQGKPESRTTQSIGVAAATLLWVALSASVILYNKYVLAVFGFPYPVALTLMHMGFSSALAGLIVRLGFVDRVHMTTTTYLTSVLPIGALFAAVLWLGNAAYLYLSVSFIQMLKAFMPVAVYSVGIAFRTETFSWATVANLLVVVAGVVTASYGELSFVWVGVVLQMVSIVLESVRLTLVQILLQSRGIKLNPLTTLYYVAPCCFGCLLVPFVFLELPLLRRDPNVQVDFLIFGTNAAMAFCLNLSVFLLVGKSSALTMNLAGVAKDWLLIGLSVMLFAAPVSALNLIGYAVAFSAVFYYNYRKMQAKRRLETEQASPRCSV